MLQRQRGRDAPHFEQHQSATDRHALQSLAEWSLNFSPIVGLDDQDSPEALLLDIAGCDHLFGSERGLALRMQGNLKHWGYTSQLAVADTIGAAWALARYAREPLTIVPAHGRSSQDDMDHGSGDDAGNTQSISRLPVEALRLPSQVVLQLRELDIRSIDQLNDLPRPSLPSRFGPDVLLRLDQIRGLVPEQIQPIRPLAPPSATWSSDDPLDDRQGVSIVLRRLLRRILQQLASRGHGIACLQCRLECGDDPVRFSVRLVRASAEFKRLDELLQLELERVPIPGPVSLIHIEAPSTVLLESQQPELFETGQHNDRRELARLVERLSSRLGAEAVCHPRLVADAQPEHASRLVSCIEHSRSPVQDNSNGGATLLRPLRLLERPLAIRVISVFPAGPPIRFEWEQPYVVSQSWGPERIATGWWRSPHVERDYYRIEAEGGQRFWLFRNVREGDWYLHGVFD